MAIEEIPARKVVTCDRCRAKCGRGPMAIFVDRYLESAHALDPFTATRPRVDLCKKCEAGFRDWLGLASDCVVADG